MGRTIFLQRNALLLLFSISLGFFIPMATIEATPSSPVIEFEYFAWDLSPLWVENNSLVRDDHGNIISWNGTISIQLVDNEINFSYFFWDVVTYETALDKNFSLFISSDKYLSWPNGSQIGKTLYFLEDKEYEIGSDYLLGSTHSCNFTLRCKISTFGTTTVNDELFSYPILTFSGDGRINWVDYIIEYGILDYLFGYVDPLVELTYPDYIFPSGEMKLRETSLSIALEKVENPFPLMDVLILIAFISIPATIFIVVSRIFSRLKQKQMRKKHKRRKTTRKRDKKGRTIR